MLDGLDDPGNEAPDGETLEVTGAADPCAVGVETPPLAMAARHEVTAGWIEAATFGALESKENNQVLHPSEADV